MSWTARIRKPNLTLGDPVEFTSGTLVENAYLPDALVLEGRLRTLAPAMVPNYGLVLRDDEGRLRFSGIYGQDGIERRGNRIGAAAFVSDTAQLWWRTCYPVPANPWTTAGQNAKYDVQTGSVEDRIIGYVNRNLGPGARPERRLARLRMPTSQHRGPSAKSAVRFTQLGQLVAGLAESANLRVRIVQTFDPDGSPWLDLVIDTTPDLTAWARFGDVGSGGSGVLGAGWRYKIGRPTATTMLSAAAGEGVDRFLNAATDTTAETLWGARVEMFEDDRGTGTAPDKRADWVAAQKALAEVEARVANANRDLAAAETVLDVASNAYNDKATSANLAARNKAQQRYDAAADEVGDAAVEENTASANEAEAHVAYDNALVADLAEITAKLQEGLASNVGASEISAPLGVSDFELGTEIPLAAKVAAELDGQPIVERLRQVTTTIARSEGEATVQVAGVIGDPDSGLKSPTQKKISQMLRRITNLERST